MKRRFSEEQIIGILQQREIGMQTADICREHGISQNTFYAWRSKFGGIGCPLGGSVKRSVCANWKPRTPN